MTDSTNMKSLKAAYAAWGSSKTKPNTAGLQSLLANTCQIESVDQTNPGMRFAEKAEAIAYLTAIFEDWEMIYFRPEKFVEQGNRIAMFGMCSWKYKANGATAECRIANLWEFDQEGKAISMIDVFDSAKAVAVAMAPKSEGTAVV